MGSQKALGRLFSPMKKIGMLTIGQTPRDDLIPGLMEEDGVRGLLDRLVKEEPDLVFLNCFGFPYSIKRQVQQATGKPTIYSSALIARIIKKLSNQASSIKESSEKNHAP